VKLVRHRPLAGQPDGQTRIMAIIPASFANFFESFERRTSFMSDVPPT
jgi:hypothetical protein